jgi:predicted ATPase
MKNTYFVVFSGGCYSGKTTTMQKFTKALENKGVKVKVLDEIVRKHKIQSIDKLRKNPVAYLDFQNRIINEKIEAELSCLNENRKQVVVCDRAITDSLFYLLFYVDKANLNEEQMALYANLYESIDQYAKRAFSEIYDLLIEFKPINKNETYDSYRPKNISINKYIEYKMINTLNDAYMNTSTDLQALYLDLNKGSYDDLLEVITNNIAKRYDKD